MRKNLQPFSKLYNSTNEISNRIRKIINSTDMKKESNPNESKN